MLEFVILACNSITDDQNFGRHVILGNVPNFIYKFAMPLNLALKDNP
jgi:hypothetical protein